MLDIPSSSPRYKFPVWLALPSQGLGLKNEECALLSSPHESNASSAHFSHFISVLPNKKLSSHFISLSRSFITPSPTQPYSPLPLPPLSIASSFPFDLCSTSLSLPRSLAADYSKLSLNHSSFSFF
ncbi:hypothetical protein AMTRI_Chr09g22530 [Amborella trichopoda]